jgi:hypothetical protein
MPNKNFKDICDKLNVITISKDDYRKIVKDRIDFGFDSVYFRYAEVCDELAVYKAKLHGSDPTKERNYMNGRKQHFYEALEQLLMAHEKEGENSDTYE